jgi:hypothetical protein
MKKTLLNCLLTICIVTFGFSQTVWDPIQNIDPSVGADPYVISSGDLDGDTFIDIVVGTYNFTSDFVKWYKNDGSGNFTLQTVVSNSATLQGIGGLTVADLDGINGNDLIVGSYTGKVVWFANNGAGGFGSEQLIGNLVGTGQVVVTDVNNDGDLDVAAVGYDAGKVVWFAGDGTGSFGTEQIIDSVDFPGNVSFADFDGDGDLDALLGFADGTTSGTIEIYYNQYIESGTMTVSWIKDTVTVNSGNPFLFVAAFADVNDDGILDIIKSDNTSGDVAWYSKIKNGASTETMISDETIIDRPAVVAVADFDNDTYNDVILTDGGSVDDALIWFESTDVGTFNTEALIADHNYQVFGITIADFDSDGDKDIASVGFFSDTLDWYENKLETLSNPENEFQSVQFYPNPTKSKLYFRSNTLNNIHVTVFDILGKKVIDSEVFINTPLDVSALKSGLYILKFNKLNTTYKFVKE